MATKKHLSLIYELETFANTYLGKVTKFQVDDLFLFWSSEQFTGLEVENTLPSVLIGLKSEKKYKNHGQAEYHHTLKRKKNSVKCRARDSNLGPLVYEASLLPAELSF